MARFSTDKNLYMDTDRRVIFGDSGESNLWYDVSGMRISSTISGVDPTQSYHLTTKFYVDDEIATLSGSMVLDHGGLTGLGDDDHTQYILATGTRAFTGTVGGVTPTDGSHLTTKDYVDSLTLGLDWQDSVLDISNSPPASGTLGDRYIIGTSPTGAWVGNANNIAEYNGVGWDITASNEGFAAWVEDEDMLYVYNGTAWVKFGATITHSNLLGLNADDHVQYSLIDGTRAFTGTVSGIDPTDNAHLATKYYVDSEISSLPPPITDHGGLSGLGDDDHPQYILVDGSRGFTSTVSGVSPTEDYHLATKSYVDGAVTSGIGVLSHSSLTDLDADDHHQYILVNGTRAFTSTVSGIDPTEDAHLTTKYYVDTKIATLSGSIVFDHGDLTGLGDDDHIQYILVDGSRAFTSTVSGVDPVEDAHLATKYYVDSEILTLSGSMVFDHGELTGLGDDDHTQYILVDGTRAFTSTVSGVDPTEDAHLATKYYVDTEIATLSGSIVFDHGDLTGLGDDDHTQYILVDGSRAFTSTVSGIDPVEDEHLATKAYVDSLTEDVHKQGRTSIPDNAEDISIVFASPFTDTDYSISVILSNTVDSKKFIYPMIITTKSGGGFTAEFSGKIKSANYYLEWIAKHD